MVGRVYKDKNYPGNIKKDGRDINRMKKGGVQVWRYPARTEWVYPHESQLPSGTSYNKEGGYYQHNNKRISDIGIKYNEFDVSTQSNAAIFNQNKKFIEASTNSSINSDNKFFHVKMSGPLIMSDITKLARITNNYHANSTLFQMFKQNNKKVVIDLSQRIDWNRGLHMSDGKGGDYGFFIFIQGDNNDVTVNVTADVMSNFVFDAAGTEAHFCFVGQLGANNRITINLNGQPTGQFGYSVNPYPKGRDWWLNGGGDITYHLCRYEEDNGNTVIVNK